MRTLAILCLGFSTVLQVMAGETAYAAPTNAPAVISLRDQFEAQQRLAFPTTNVFLFTIADKKGSEQIAGWVAPVKERFEAKVEICGIADVSAVPRPLRGLVRKKFLQAQTHPVMLDWTADVVKAFGCVSDQVNVFVVDGEGRILMRAVGPVSKEKLRELCSLLELALGSKGVVAAK